MLSSPFKLNSATTELVPDDQLVIQHATVSTTEGELDTGIQIVDDNTGAQSDQTSSIEQIANANDLVNSPTSSAQDTKSDNSVVLTPSRETLRQAKTKGQLKTQLLKKRQQSAKTALSVAADKANIFSSEETLHAESKDAGLLSLSSASTMNLMASHHSVTENSAQVI